MIFPSNSHCLPPHSYYIAPFDLQFVVYQGKDDKKALASFFQTILCYMQISSIAHFWKLIQFYSEELGEYIQLPVVFVQKLSIVLVSLVNQLHPTN